MINKGAIIRKIIVYAVYILLFTSLQVSFPGRLGFAGQTADIMFVFVVVSGYFYGFYDGAVVGLITGMIRDCFAPPALIGLDGNIHVTAGIGMLVLFLAGVIGASFFTGRMHRNIPFAFAAIAFTTLVYKVSGHLLAFAMTSMLTSSAYNISAFDIVVKSCLMQILLNLIAGVLLIPLIKFLGPAAPGAVTDPEDVIISEKEGKSWLQI